MNPVLTYGGTESQSSSAVGTRLTLVCSTDTKIGRAHVSDLYRHHFPPCDFSTERQVALEFGFVETKDVKYRRDKYVPHGVNIDSVYDLGVDRASPGKYPRDEWLR